jgi:predicted transglutaminase-like cysteine proteinase
MTNDRFGIVRRSFLLASVWGFVATPVFANFGHPVHTHSAKIEARLKVWRDHVAKEHDYLIQSREPHIVRWREWTERIPSNSEEALLAGVNRQINEEIVYKSDYAVHGTSDFWATLSDTLIHGGDCEDYALAKSTTLAFRGWPETHNHLVIGMLHRGGKSEPHAVLVVERSDGRFWVLDNLSNTVVPAERMAMQPLYGVDNEGVWLFTRPTRS